MSQQQQTPQTTEQEKSTWEEISSLIGETEKSFVTGFAELKKVQNELPQQITSWKQKEILSQASINQRHFLVCLASLGVAAFTFRFQRGFIPVLRNTTISYALTGLIFTPEIVNPFIALKKQ